MKLSAPIYRLKHQAKLLTRRENIPHHQALDRIARQEGFDSWSLLAKQLTEGKTGRSLMEQLQVGDLLLLGARPGHGKTLLSLEVAIAAMKAGHKSMFFSLDFNEADVAKSFEGLGTTIDDFADRFEFDGADNICAQYIIDRLASAPIGSVVIVDYLQLLDQRRDTPPLMDQITALRAFSKERGLIFVFISQIQRGFDAEDEALPGLKDVRLPNPLDLGLFDKSCFLNNGELEIQALA